VRLRLWTVILSLLMLSPAQIQADGYPLVQNMALDDLVLAIVPYRDWAQLRALASLSLNVLDLEDQALAAVVAPAQADRLRSLGFAPQVVEVPAHPDQYYLAMRRPDSVAPIPADAGRSFDYTAGLILLRATPDQAERWTAAGFWIRKLLGGVVLPTTPPAGAIPRPSVLSTDPLIQQLVNSVSQSEMYGTIQELQDDPNRSGYDALGSRYSYSSKISPKRDYIQNHLQALGLDVRLDHFTLGGVGLDNVEGTLPGSGPDPNVIYVACAHYDSTSNDPYNVAPGADDNGSGTAGVLEAARVLSRYHFKHTLRFVTFAGEEQGMIGSQYYASRAYTAHNDIRGVVNLDMIGWDSNHDYVMEIHAGTGSSSQPVGAALRDAVTAYGINLSPQYITQGSLTFSDHSSFWNKGYPAIMAIEDWADHSSNYHRTTDTLPTLRLSFVDGFVKATVATLAGLAEIIPPGLTVEHFGPGQLVTGTLHNLTISYSNAAPTAAAGVRITDTLSAGLTYVADDSGILASQPCPGVVVWQIGNMAAYAPRQSFVVTFSVAADLPLGALATSQVDIGGTTQLEDVTDNQARWTGIVPMYRLQLPIITRSSP
jgi:uncharacterized repeat protein (TIGR01451 family)